MCEHCPKNKQNQQQQQPGQGAEKEAEQMSATMAQERKKTEIRVN